jgi:hypothetical protein
MATVQQRNIYLFSFAFVSSLKLSSANCCTACVSFSFQHSTSPNKEERLLLESPQFEHTGAVCVKAKSSGPTTLYQRRTVTRIKDSFERSPTQVNPVQPSRELGNTSNKLSGRVLRRHKDIKT